MKTRFPVEAIVKQIWHIKSENIIGHTDPKKILTIWAEQTWPHDRDNWPGEVATGWINMIRLVVISGILNLTFYIFLLITRRIILGSEGSMIYGQNSENKRVWAETIDWFHDE